MCASLSAGSARAENYAPSTSRLPPKPHSNPPGKPETSGSGPASAAGRPRVSFESAIGHQEVVDKEKMWKVDCDPVLSFFFHLVVVGQVSDWHFSEWTPLSGPEYHIGCSSLC